MAEENTDVRQSPVSEKDADAGSAHREGRPKAYVPVWAPLRDGWNGIICGRSTLSDVKSRLGAPFTVDSDATGKHYYFKGKAVRLFIPSDGDKITSIMVLARVHDSSLIPPRLNDAVKLYGPLDVIKVKNNGEIWYARPGLHVVCNSGSDENYDVLWIEFWNPLQGVENLPEQNGGDRVSESDGAGSGSRPGQESSNDTPTSSRP